MEKRKYTKQENKVYGRPRDVVRRVRIQILEVNLDRSSTRMKGSSRSLTVYNCSPDQALSIVNEAFRSQIRAGAQFGFVKK